MLICLTSISGKAFSEESKTPGIIESLERLLDLHKDQYQKNKSSIQSNLKVVSDLTSYTDIKLDPQYMKSIIFHSDERFLKLAQKNECFFLSVLETNLFKTAEGNIDSILIAYKNKDGTTSSATMLKDDFFDQIYKKKCLNNREYSILFSETNTQKTVEGIKFSIPRNKSECSNIHKEWLDNPFTPYLCRIQQLFKKPGLKKQADFYKERIPLMQRIYLDNLCNSISNPEMFCMNYLKSDVWNKILNSELPDYKMSYKCQQMFNKKEKLTTQEMKNCASKLASDSTFCETRGNLDYPSNFPLQNCNNISLALNKSKLVNDYHDCPGNIDNEALTNIHRIVNHFAPRKIVTNKETCSGEANYTLAKLDLEVKHEAGWPLKVCYLNRIDNKQACTTYIPGSRAGEPLSEDQVVAKILYTQKGAPQKTTCRIVDSKTYNPLRSEFKFGCYIVYSAESCSAVSCDKKVIWEEKLQPDIKFTGIPIFDYFPTNFMSERYSFTSLIDEVKRTQERVIKNLTDLKYYLDKMPNGIIHGIGCAEDMLPEQFQRIAINQCHPMPFIIDGHIEKNNETLLVSRLAIDDVHTPRLITWPHIFNAVSAYQDLQPLNTWTLNGIKK
ncbi:MAG: hypothetical protein H7336_12950 [Bacteriovorax sp.]|nr:hypothetical protein [Bacteriovorax sp.]